MIPSLTKIKKRALVLFGIVLSCLALMVFRVAYWQIVRGEEMRTAAENQQTGSAQVTASRGSIYDRNGKVLAESAGVNTLVCNPQDVKDKGNAEVIAEKLSVVIDMDYEKIYNILTKNNRYQVIKKRITTQEAEQVQNLKNKEIDETVANAFNGVYFEEDSKRYYSFNVAPHVLGFTGYDNNGLQGIELTFDKELTGKAGSVISAQTASGTTISDLDYEEYQEASKGADVVLTIDETIQHFLEKHLETAVKESELKEGAAGIIMNPKTGEILAMATKPDFDVNTPYDTTQFEANAVDFEYESALLGRTVTKEDEKLFTDESVMTTTINTKKAKILGDTATPEPTQTPEGEEQGTEKAEKEEQEITLTTEQKEELKTERTVAIRNKMWRNKAISDVYEPGSTFKIITAASALEEGVVDLNTPFFCSGSKKIGKYNISCHKAAGHGAQTFLEGVQHSCNPVFMETGMKMGSDRFMEYFTAFGLTEKTGIELIGESESIYYKNKTLSDTDLATSAFGQGFNVSPLQMVTAISAVVNGGNLMKPQIVKEIRNDEGVIKSYQPEVVNKVISEETSKTMREVLESVVSSPDGTGKNAYVKGYRIGGKTGTSEKGDRSDKTKRIASFAGFAPADDPEIVCLIMLDEPQVDNKFGGTIAAPLAGEIIADVLEYLGIPKQYAEGETPDETKEVADVRGLSVSEAKEQLTEEGFKVKVDGKGDSVLDMLPKPGVHMTQNSTIVLYTQETDTEEKTVTVPDVTGCSIAEARSKITQAGLNFAIAGAGQNESSGAYAFKQSVKPGEKVAPSTVIDVEFRHQASD